jgi:hypothetical protein
VSGSASTGRPRRSTPNSFLPAIDAELEHGTKDPETNVTDEDMRSPSSM